MFLLLWPIIQAATLTFFLGFLTLFIPDLFNALLSLLPTVFQSQPVVAEMTGLAAWFAIKLRFVDCLQFASALFAFRTAIRCIPYIRNII